MAQSKKGAKFQKVSEVVYPHNEVWMLNISKNLDMYIFVKDNSRLNKQKAN